MCNYHAKRSPVFRANQRLLTKQELSPEERRVIEQFMREFGSALDGPQRDLVADIRNGNLDLSRLSAIRADVSATFGSYTETIGVVYREQVEEGVRAGRQLAARRFDLDGSFNQVPERLLDELDDWAIESTNEVVDSMSDEVARTLRSAAEEGQGIDEMADLLQEDVFENRLKDSKARSVARTEVNSAANEGANSAYQDAGGVVAEEWLSASDDRTRDDHLDADGQIVPVDGTFLVGGEEMAHPGDKSASIELWAECRCSVAPVFADQLSDSQLETIEGGGRIGA